MSALTTYKINDRWPAKNPDILQLYSFPTPNGVKVSIMLEEIGLDYEAHTVKLNETTTPEFLSLNPNNKIPAIIDPNGPDGQTMTLWESGAILIYLAEKSGQFLPSDPTLRKDIPDPRPRERYQQEAKRLLAVLEQQLSQTEYLAGDQYTIADIATWPWIRTAKVFYKAEEALGFSDFPSVMAWWDRCMARPASERSLNIPDREG